MISAERVAAFVARLQVDTWRPLSAAERALVRGALFPRGVTASADPDPPPDPVRKAA